MASGFRPGLSTKSFTVLKYYGPMVDDGVVKIPPTATGQPLPVPPPNDTEQVGELIAQRFPVPSLVDVSANKNLALRRCGRLAGAVARWLNAERHPKRPSFAAQAWRYLVISAACLAGDDALSGHAAKQPGTSAAGSCGAGGQAAGDRQGPGAAVGVEEKVPSERAPTILRTRPRRLLKNWSSGQVSAS